MLFIITSVATVAFGVYWYLNRHKPLKYFLRDLRYAIDMQGCGAAGLIDDWVNKSRNNVVLPDASEKIAVITGGARGIGKEVVRGLLKAKMTVIMGVRDPQSIGKLQDSMENGRKLVAFPLDLQSLKTVKEFADNVLKAYPEVHLLVNNAGIMYVDYKETEDSFETHMAVNHLSHFYLAHLLLPALKKGGKPDSPSRIVNVSSCAHYAGYIHFDDLNAKKHYDSVTAYAQSKLAQLMITRHVNKLLEESGENVKCYSVHPGIVNTDLFDNTMFSKLPWVTKTLFKSPEKGAVSILFACFNNEILNKGGLYISNCQEGISNRFSKNIEHQQRLFQVSCDLVGVEQEKYGKN
ncbi:retinol dehydrogenase 12-like [Aricia agestis]|uniref:retinol dehydrogenase 12-like n=1 Tax=Aricia agestis TaxID=91739 RepID=UPI001C208897|nr:retinol dehydrogenase 12-like [Aricia agestis]